MYHNMGKAPDNLSQGGMALYNRYWDFIPPVMMKGNSTGAQFKHQFKDFNI